MPRKSAALIGPGVGPMVQVAGPAEITLKGLPEGEEALVLVYCKKGIQRGEKLLAAGRHALEECSFVQVAYKGRSRTFIACVLIGG